MKRKWWYVIIGSAVAVLLVVGIGVKVFMDAQERQKAVFEQRIAKAKADVTELIEWNFTDIESVTFDYDGSGGSGVLRVGGDKSLTTTPAGGLNMNGYVNGDENFRFQCELDGRTLVPAPDTFTNKGEMGYGEPGGACTDFNGALRKYYKGGNKNNMWLSLVDIKKLKDEGFSKNITAEEIEKYFEEKSK